MRVTVVICRWLPPPARASSHWTVMVQFAGQFAIEPHVVVSVAGPVPIVDFSEEIQSRTSF